MEESSKNNDLAERLAALPPEKRTLILRQLRDARLASEQGPDLAHLPAGQGAERPTSVQQELAWLEWRKTADSAASNIASLFRIRGGLDFDAIERALQEYIRRHEILRTSFEDRDGRLYAMAAPDCDLQVRLIDLVSLVEEAREIELRRLVEEGIEQGFDVREAPLVRTVLFRLGEDETALLWVAHRLVWDTYSYPVFASELSVLYAGYAVRRHSVLPPLYQQYADYARWQRLSLSPYRYEPSTAGRKGAHGLVPTRLSADRADRHNRGPVGSCIQYSVEGDQVRVLAELAKEQDAPPPVAFAACLCIVLSRYAGTDDIVLGTLIQGRDDHEFGELPGSFADIVAIRVSMSDSPTFVEFLNRMQKTYSAAVLLRALNEKANIVAGHHLEPSDLPRPVLGLTLENGEPKITELCMLPAEQQLLRTEGAQLDLDLRLRQCDHTVTITAMYRRRRFSSEGIRRLLRAFEAVLHQAAENPHTCIRELEVIDHQDIELLTRSWTGGRHAAISEMGVHNLIESQARQRPHSIAMVFDGRVWTYAQLNDWANQLANYLARKTGGVGGLIVVHLPRGPVAVAAILATLKIGAAYVPVDSALPAERVAYVVSDCKPDIVLTDTSLLLAHGKGAVPVLCLDVAADEIERESKVGPPMVVPPRQLAYVMYTSGSTGRPKGVMIEHVALVQFVLNTVDAFSIAREDRILHFASIGFDVSVFEIFVPLVAGGALVIATQDQRNSMGKLSALMRDEQVTVAELPPVLMPMLTPEDLPVLRLVSVGGEEFPGELVERWASDARTFINGYGPTEATVAVTLMDCKGRYRSNPPIGRPMSNQEAYVLDEHMKPRPIGCAGELYLGGLGLARGYWNRPGLTAETFVCHPFGGAQGERLYRTGDRASWLSDGNLQFLGRSDRQIQFRGHRVEPGEIESVLLEIDGVRQAIVEKVEQPEHESVLVAYVVPEGGGTTEDDLRQVLREKLPAYMVPTHFLLLDGIKTTPSGKVDLSALPPFGRSDTVDGEKFVPARNAIERRIVDEVVPSILGIGEIGVTAPILDSGGDSLQATQMLSRVRTLFGVEVSLRSFFECPTVAHLATLIRDARERGRRQREEMLSTLEAIQPSEQASASADYPATRMQRHLWQVQTAEPQTVWTNVSLAMRITGALDVKSWTSALVALVRRQSALRLAFVDLNGDLTQYISEDIPLRFPVIDLTEEKEIVHSTWRRIRTAALEPLDPGLPPLWRAQILRTGADEHVFHLVVHHMIWDGWSSAVFLRDLAELYNAEQEGRPAELPELDLRVVDYAVWQEKWLDSAAGQRALSYWRERVQVPRAMLTKKPEADDDSTSISYVPFSIDRTQVEQIRSLCARERATLFMGLASIYAMTLSRHFSDEDIIIGVPLAGRTRAEFEDLIGLFLNVVPIRVRVSKRQSFQDILAEVRRTSVDAYSHQDVSVQRIMEHVDLREDGRPPFLFHAAFLYDNVPEIPAAFRGLNVAAMQDPNQLPLPKILEFCRSLGSGLSTSLVIAHRRQELAGMIEHANGSSVAGGECRRLVQSFLDEVDRVLVDPAFPR